MATRQMDKENTLIEASGTGLIKTVIRGHGAYITKREAVEIIAKLTDALNHIAPLDIDITPRHVMVARYALGWHQTDLASAAKVAKSTLVDYERGARATHPQSLRAIAEALAHAKIVFLDNGILWRDGR